MKNVQDWQKVTAIVLSEEEFDEVIDEITDGQVGAYVDFENGIVYVNSSSDASVETSDIWDMLAQYYGVAEITSIHADDCGSIWIAYNEAVREKEEFVADIINLLERYCKENGLELPDNDQVHIYGNNYMTIAGPIRILLDSDPEGSPVEFADESKFTEEAIANAINDCLIIFLNLVKPEMVSTAEKTRLFEAIHKLFEEWKLIEEE